jgi:TRAP transporter TAXI family solute receptor
MKKSSKVWALVLAVLLVLSVTAGCGGGGNAGDKTEEPKPAEKQFVSIATGGTSGTYFPIGGAIAEILNTKGGGVFNASAQSTGASIENIGLINDGKVEIAMVQNDAAFYAYDGSGVYTEKMPKVNGMCTLYNEPLQLVATSKSGIKSIADLKGKRVAVGAPGSINPINVEQIIGLYGLTFNDIKTEYVSFAESAAQLKDGQLDASFVFAGYPTSAIIDVATQHDIVIVPLEDDKIEELTKKYPYYSKTMIPAGTYTLKEDKDINTITVRAMLIVNADLQEDMVYNATKAIFDNLDILHRSHSRAEDVTLETSQEGMSVPLHPGAEKYFKEKGVL